MEDIKVLLKRIFPFLAVIFCVQLAHAKMKCNFLCDRVPAAHEVHKYLGNVNEEPVAPQFAIGPIDVLVWNVYKGRKDNFIRAFEKISVNKDLVLLQEATDGNLVKPALDMLTKISWNMAINFFMKNNVAAGVVTGTYVQPNFSVALQTTDFEPFVKSPKVLLINNYSLNSTSQLLVINIHGINFAGDDAFARHLQLAEPYIANHVGPILFAGDFNTKNEIRSRMLINFAQKHGMSRAPWNNPIQNQLDDAITRGLRIISANLDHSVVGSGSDHPALLLKVIPE